jgi:hypothetical protein
MIVGVGFCKIKGDSNFLLVLKIKCTKFHQDWSKTVDLHTKYTNRHSVLYIYRLPCRLFTYPYVFQKTHVYIFPLMREYFDYKQYKPVFRIRFHKLKVETKYVNES